VTMQHPNTGVVIADPQHGIVATGNNQCIAAKGIGRVVINGSCVGDIKCSRATSNDLEFVSVQMIGCCEMVRSEEVCEETARTVVQASIQVVNLQKIRKLSG